MDVDRFPHKYHTGLRTIYPHPPRRPLLLNQPNLYTHRQEIIEVSWTKSSFIAFSSHHNANCRRASEVQRKKRLN